VTFPDFLFTIFSRCEMPDTGCLMPGTYWHLVTSNWHLRSNSVLL
jgi:hypothetical protein